MEENKSFESNTVFVSLFLFSILLTVIIPINVVGSNEVSEVREINNENIPQEDSEDFPSIDFERLRPLYWFSLVLIMIIYGVVIIKSIFLLKRKMDRKVSNDSEDAKDLKKIEYEKEKSLRRRSSLVGIFIIALGISVYGVAEYFALGELYERLGLVVAYVGVFTAILSYIPYKKGIKNNEEKSSDSRGTKVGVYSVTLGIIGGLPFIYGTIPWIMYFGSMICGVLAIPMGNLAIKEGDKLLGTGGIILGCAIIVLVSLFILGFL